MEVYTLILASFAIIAVLLINAFNVLHRASRRSLLHKERLAAIEKGVPLPEDAQAELEAEGRPTAARRDPLLHGTILAALGLGMLVASKLARGGEFPADARQFLAYLELWAYPVMFVGIGLLLFAFFSREKKS